MNRLFRYLDPIFGLALAASLLMVVITAWPGVAIAASRADGNGDRATEQRTPGDFVAVRTNGVDVVVRPALAASVTDMLGADGYLFGTPANFGYMAGALKHFFDTVYYPVLDYVAGRPYGLWVHGNNDTLGAASSVERIATGLNLVKTAATVEITGAVDAAVRQQAGELGGVLAATLMVRP